MERTSGLIMYRNKGRVNFYYRGQAIAPGSTFKAPVGAIPKAFGDIIEIVEVTVYPKQIVEPIKDKEDKEEFELPIIKKASAKSFNVFHKGEKINDKPVNEEDANRLVQEITEANEKDNE